jgi:acetyl esterase/lipase
MALGAGAAVQAQDKSFDAAAAFGARPSVISMSMSPDGKQVAYIAPAKKQGTAVYTLSLEKGASARATIATGGDEPLRLTHCDWLSNERLACTAYGVKGDPAMGLVPLTRVFAFDANGANMKVLSTNANTYTYGYVLYGGEIIDRLPDEQGGAVLMTREYRPDAHTGSRLGSSKDGLGVDRIDTRSLAISPVEPADPDALSYLTDGHGQVRIMGIVRRNNYMDTGVFDFLYRVPGSRSWVPLSRYNETDDSGFYPLAIDRDLNIAYGWKKLDGRMAIYSVQLDESLKDQVVYARPDVDVSGLFEIRQRVVGARYVTETGHTHYFDPKLEQLMAAFSRALPGRLIDVVDASADEGKLLLRAGSDSDAGVYYIFDRNAHQLNTFLAVRAELEGVKLAKVKPITYPATDGVSIPAYLTLPPGQENPRGLPAIVLPHGGPSARDSWGFDWLAQYFAARGFVVLQPNYRGSSGYGDAWEQRNGFRSWSVAIDDVLAAGRFLVKEGIADPGKLAIVGWSYGGYAALQSAVVDPGLFKAVVAIAPVTDLGWLKEEHRHWTNFNVVSDFVGSGSSMHDGSPAEHANKINVPVLLFHGTLDFNVRVDESRRMAERLKAAGKACELVTWDGLDHQLDNSEVRTEMLRKSDLFLRKAMGM